MCCFGVLIVCVLIAIGGLKFNLPGTSQSVLNSRIYDGQDASILDFPYHVTIEDKNHQICSGSILSPNWILTTSLCTVHSRPEFYKVRAGSDLRGKGGSLHQVDKLVKHDDDIALVHLEQPIKFDEIRKPIELFGTGEELGPGTMANVSGFGWIWGNFYPERLQYVEVSIIRASKGKIHAGSNLGWGDFGAPMVVQGRLAGLGSELGEPGVYTNVACYSDWINEHVN